MITSTPVSVPTTNTSSPVTVGTGVSGITALTIQDDGQGYQVGDIVGIVTAEMSGAGSGVKIGINSLGGLDTLYLTDIQAEEFTNTQNVNYFHELGTSQEQDKVVYARSDQPDWSPRAEVTDDGNHLIITISVGTDERYSIAYQDLIEANSKVETVIEGFHYDYTFIGNVEDDLYFRTNDGAPKNRLISIDAKNPQRGNWREIIPEAPDLLDDVTLVGERIVAEYMQDAWSVVKIFDLGGKHVGNVDLPGIGTASGFNGLANDPETFFSYETFNTPGFISRLDVSTGHVDLFKKPQVAFSPDDFVVEQIFYSSKD